MSLLGKVYDPTEIEDRWYDYWLKKNYFHAEADTGKVPYTIVIPPPNVTGMLTMGHVLNNTIQDILIRKARMEGKEACWIPGTDHASIATEAKVVKMLAEKGIRKEDLSRNEFLKHAWAWKEKYGGIIINQLKKLGCSCDWERERFTMDEGYSRAVLEAFVRLYHKGLIYRGHRLVNWCPVSRSAISDEEVIYREVQGNLWYFRYPLVGDEGYVIVATTRPETMLGDTAVAVHPGDDRYQHLIGKKVKLPLVGREIPIIADSFVDPEFGTGCVKVTPAHDPNDFALGEAHGLEFINIMNEDASLNGNVPAPYRGKSREAARKLVVKDLEALGLLEKTEPHIHKVGYSERGQVPIEYYISDQWYLKMRDLVRPALEAVHSGKIRFYPGHWVKTYNHWMENIKDWCISRQLWWGHRIPIWYCGGDGCEDVLVCAIERPEQCPVCGKSEKLYQDPDVLDTWASSWLWPFAVHSWPDDSPDLRFFYPTDALVTGPDIIFFWVARMIMAGYEFMGEPPFRDVYFTSILRDEGGRKFSKSLGNSPDPFDLFNEYGTDAVRFGIMLMAPQGLDVLFSKQRLEVGRNFMNKLWNAARFVQMNLEDGKLPERGWDRDLPTPERWILSRLHQTIRNVDRQLERYHFNEAAKVIYEFTWSDFCDWYIEIAKVRYYGDDPELADLARIIAVHVLKTILRLLHPYAPFITEELWSRFKYPEEKDLIVSPWPQYDGRQQDEEAEAEMKLLQEVVTAVRTIRSRMNVPPARKATMVVRGGESTGAFLARFEPIIHSLAGIETITTGEALEKPAHSATAVVRNMEIYIPLKGLIDLDLERRRLEKRKAELEGHLRTVEKKLGNENFLSRAPLAVVERERQKRADMSEELEKVVSNLEMLQ
ncbi:MAG: valine--tRNA ligase [FCB group bacterium]|nr:valine--tRNA ligase [FCB group bacterium]